MIKHLIKNYTYHSSFLMYSGIHKNNQMNTNVVKINIITVYNYKSLYVSIGNDINVYCNSIYITHFILIN